jgi:hypothetical protein
MRDTGESWRVFAAVVLGVAGVMRFFDALWAFNYDGAVPNQLESAIFGHTLDTYGWIYLIMAAVFIASAFLVLNRSQLGRWVGVAAGALGAITAVWWMPFYPIWSMVYVMLSVLVIYALVAHGGREDSQVREPAPYEGSAL